MNSRRAAILAAGAALLALAGPGCRDLVEPRAPAGSEPSLTVEVIGLDAALHEARITIDSRPWIGERGAVFEAVSDRGLAGFPGAEPGAYDVQVEPDRGSATPPWTQTGVGIGFDPVRVAYPGVEAVVELDWPGFGGVEPAEMGVQFGYRLPAEWRYSGYEEHWRRAWLGEDGLYRATLPWYGSYALKGFAANASFAHNFGYPDSVVVEPGALLRPGYPVRFARLRFDAGGRAADGGEIELRIFELEERAFHAANDRLFMVLDLDALPDSLPVLLEMDAQLHVVRRSGAVFLPIHLLADATHPLPETLSLGRHEVLLRVESPGGEPLSGARLLELDGNYVPNSAGAQTDGGGILRLWLDPGAHMVRLVHPEGYSGDAVFEISGDRTVVVRLGAE